MTGRLARAEANGRIVGAVKLANVALAMLWGFAVTFVFVRVLPIADFRAFLVLVAFANFTISADFGFSGIVYARLRRARLEAGGGTGAGFDPAEIAMLAAFMLLVVFAGGLAIGIALSAGLVPTRYPGLFLAFYLLAATNIFGLLAKRALAALDRNLWWEGIDAARRIAALLLLFAALRGLPILASVLLQIGLAVVTLGFGFAAVHRGARMRRGDWRPRGLSITRPYRADMGATMLLTMSDVAAYNAPYFGIAAMTADPRPLLVFDFVFKISRALTAVVRAVTEAALPRLTRAWHRRDSIAVASALRRLVGLALGMAGALASVLLIVGSALSAILFDGQAALTSIELALLAMLLLGLSTICVSTYVHNGVGRFGALLAPSFLFLTGSLVSIGAGAVAGPRFALAFLGAYAVTHVALGVRHLVLLRGLVRS